MSPSFVVISHELTKWVSKCSFLLLDQDNCLLFPHSLPLFKLQTLVCKYYSAAVKTRSQDEILNPQCGYVRRWGSRWGKMKSSEVSGEPFLFRLSDFFHCLFYTTSLYYFIPHPLLFYTTPLYDFCTLSYTYSSHFKTMKSLFSHLKMWSALYSFNFFKKIKLTVFIENTTILGPYLYPQMIFLHWISVSGILRHTCSSWVFPE